ncbi:MAG: ABC transporter permease [Candidatus Omnitrophica bacterium]|nr:ABC transporter permease [Candidatus Omnitrophota bacterium]
MSSPQTPQRRAATFVVRAIALAAVIGTWQILSSLNLLNTLFFPTPSQVINTLWRGFADRSLLMATASSLQRFFVGYAVSLLAGIPLGFLLARFRWLEDTLGAAALGLQSMPSICWLPLAVLWFGLSEMAIQFVVIMGSLLAIALATRDTAKGIPRLILRAGHILGAQGWKLYRHVVLPASLPGIVSGAKLGWSFAWRSLMAAEMLYVTTGLGSALTMGRELHDMSMVVATMLLIMMVGLAFNRWMFGGIERLIQARWGPIGL